MSDDVCNEDALPESARSGDEDYDSDDPDMHGLITEFIFWNELKKFLYSTIRRVTLNCLLHILSHFTQSIIPQMTDMQCVTISTDGKKGVPREAVNHAPGGVSRVSISSLCPTDCILHRKGGFSLDNFIHFKKLLTK